MDTVMPSFQRLSTESAIRGEAIALGLALVGRDHALEVPLAKLSEARS